MNEKARFAVKILKEYAKQNQTLPRCTSDLSKLEEWLILELMKVNNIGVTRCCKSDSEHLKGKYTLTFNEWIEHSGYKKLW